MGLIKTVLKYGVPFLFGYYLASSSPDLLGTREYSGHENSEQSIQSEIVSDAKRLIGTRYVYGGKNPGKDGGLDCSGLTWKIYHKSGITIPRTASAQFHSDKCKRVRKSRLELADLVFFDTLDNHKRVDHVGVYTGNGRFIHASSSKHKVTTAQFNNYWDIKYVGACRMIK